MTDEIGDEDSEEWADLMDMVHEFHKEYILAVDRKAAILLTGLFGLLGLIANAIALAPTDFQPTDQVLLLFGVSGLFGAISIVFAALVVYPRVYDTDYKGYIYWERILLHGSREEFVDAVTAPPDATTPRTEVTKNVYNLADIASMKYTWLRRSMTAVGLMFYFASVASLLQIFSDIILSVVVPSLAAVILIGLFLYEDMFI